MYSACRSAIVRRGSNRRASDTFDVRGGTARHTRAGGAALPTPRDAPRREARSGPTWRADALVSFRRDKTHPATEDTVPEPSEWARSNGSGSDRPRAQQSVLLVCEICGRILIGLSPERAVVYQKEQEHATGHHVRIEPLKPA
jgi:hypothetical protein